MRFIFTKKLKARLKNRTRYSKTMTMSINEKPRRSPEYPPISAIMLKLNSLTNISLIHKKKLFQTPPKHCIVLVVLDFFYHSFQVDLHISLGLFSAGEKWEAKVHQHFVARLGAHLKMVTKEWGRGIVKRPVIA